MDEQFLKETLNLAKKGMGWTNPNPMVGAVLVKQGRVLGRGYHKGVGLPHAEIEALKNCKKDPRGAALYVNLEPCAHFGRTPPCTDALIRSGIKKVVCCTLDPNLKVHGQGKVKLEKAGIFFKAGFLENEARLLNEAFFTFHEKKRPFVVLKFAASLDGKLATGTGDSKWITNEKARQFARKLRGQYQSVLVGINTVLQDDPHLGVRKAGKKDPVRIILDPNLRISFKAQVLRDQNVIVATTAKANLKKRKQLEEKGFIVLVFDGFIEIQKLLAELGKRQIISVLVEGGGKTLGEFVDAKAVDKVYAFHAPIIIGGEKAISITGEGVKSVQEAVRLKNITFKKFDDNLLTTGYTA